MHRVARRSGELVEMGLPPLSDSNKWQSVGPQAAGNPPKGQVHRGPNGGVGEAQHPGEDQSAPLFEGRLSFKSVEEQSSLAQFVAGSQFQNTTLFVVVLNGIWIGIDVDLNHPSLEKDGKLPLEPWATVVENLFCVYFTFEIVARIVAFGKRNLRDKSFWFDFVLVAFMVIETWIMVIIEAIMGGGSSGVLAKFSILRLMRLSRLSRIMTSLPELLTLVRGIMNAAKAVTIVFVLMLVIMYVFAIVLTAQIGDPYAPEHTMDPYWVTDEDPTAIELFGSMGDSMMSLFTRGMLCDNFAETLQAIKDRGGEWVCHDIDGEEACGREGGEVWLMWVFVTWMIISAMMLLNMLVGILCEVIDGTAKSEIAASQVSELREHIDIAFKQIDTSGDNIITPSEWKEMRCNKLVSASFGRLGFTSDHMEEFGAEIEERLFGSKDEHLVSTPGDHSPGGKITHVKSSNGPACCAGEKGIPMEEFVTNILDIRPDKDASYLDMYILQTTAERQEAQFNSQMDRIEDMLLNRTPRSVSKLAANDLPNTSAIVDVATKISVQAPPEASKLGTSSAPDPWLQGLPTDVLFAELKHRATLHAQANLSLPATGVESDVLM